MLFNPLRRYIILPIKRKRRTILNNSNALLAEFEQSWINFLSKKTYLTYRDDDHLKSMFSKNHELIILPWYLQFFAFKLKRKLAENREQASQIYNDEIKDYNKEFIKKRLARYKKFFDGTDGKPLNEEQRLAIVRDDIHNIVVAGAGSGKTEVLTKRIAYLTKRPDKVKPERILALAFQNKAASEISERLKQKYKTNVEVKTFHKLGNDILNHPNLMFSGNNTDNQQKKFIKEIFDGFLTKRDFQNKVINYMKLYSDSEVVKTEEDFTTKEDYYKYKRLLKYIALDSTPIKSEAEREIINFFITHNLNGKKLTICYEDEAEWMKYKNSDGKEIVPKPDFFFPDYNIYLEHWAIDKNGKVPDWFEGENPTEEYTKGINLKKAKFKSQKKYTLIETTYAESKKRYFLKVIENKLITALKTKYPEQEFVFTEISYKELVDRVWDECKKSTNHLPDNIKDFIVNAKVHDLTSKEISKRLSKEKWSAKQSAFAEIANIIFEEYTKRLRASNSIDFNDMINLAIKKLNKEKSLLQDKFDHILVDEYQDISMQRYNLIKSLLKKNTGCKLFCVGDDWQSIMGFAGSNLDFFVDFANYFKKPIRTDLSVNYRSIKSIVDAGADIIKNNKNQLQKETKSFNNKEEKIEIYSSTHNEDYFRQYYKQVAQHCINKIVEYHNNGYDWKDIMILRRIISDPSKSIIIGNILKYAKENNIPIKIGEYGIGIPLMSVHGSKGLQAKVVFILNVDKGLYGFPCELQNPDILEPAIIGPKKNQEEAERRLFYVAVTRAKEKVIIYTQRCAKSKFLNEIKKHAIVEELKY